MLTGQFNGTLSGKVLVFADESAWQQPGGSRQAERHGDRNPPTPIERKFLPLSGAERPGIVIASNNEWPIAIPMSDRRFVVLDVVEHKRQDDTYSNALRDQLEQNCGHAAQSARA